jgi:hypothetical protein
MIFSMIIKAEEHGSDLLVWVELRGFEPLTPSMRTKRAVSRTGQVTVFAQFSDLRKDTITAFEAV